MTAENLSLVFDALTAFGAVAIVVQLYLFLRNSKYESCHRLYEAFCSCAELTRFHGAVLEGLENRVTAEEIGRALQGTNEVDAQGYRGGAQAYSNFIRYVFYNLDENLIRTRDVAHIIGPWFVEYYRLSEIIQGGPSSLSEERHAHYFPAVPGSLRSQVPELSETPT